MAETTQEMWSCHERNSSGAKQQSSSPHPIFHNCQGGSIPLPQRYGARCAVQRRQKCGAAGTIGSLLVGFGARKERRHCISLGAWLLCHCSCSYRLICVGPLACKLGLGITSTFGYIHLEYSRCLSQEAAV